MTDRITASVDTLMEQGPMTVSVYLAEVAEQIDAKLGHGFSRRNPVFFGLCLLAAAIDCAVLVLAQQTRAGLNEIGSDRS